MYFTNPLISVVIPVYNGSKYLRSAIDSTLAQTYPNVEVIVINDGSTDNGATEQIALSYGERIRYFCKENGGVATALNFGIEQMRGDYFSWLSHDDMYHPQKLYKQMAAVESAEQHDAIVYCDHACVDENGNLLHNICRSDSFSFEELHNPIFVLTRALINGCCLLIHKSHFTRVGMFNPTLLTTQDYDMWFRMLRGSKLLYVADILLYSRQHEEQDSRKMIDVCLREGNELYLGFLRSLSEQEKCVSDGSVYDFYKNMYKRLCIMKYWNAAEFAKQEKKKCVRESKPSISSSPPQTNSMPLISVVLYVPKGKEWRKSLESVRQQTYTNIEILVIHEDSVEPIHKAEERWLPISKSGMPAALNLAMECVRGEYLTILVAGERFLPEKLSLQLELLNAYGAPAAALCGYVCEAVHGRRQMVLPDIKCGKLRAYLHSDSKHSMRLSAALLPTFLVSLCFGFDETLPHAWEYAFWLRLDEVAVVLTMKKILLISPSMPFSSEAREELRCIMNASTTFIPTSATRENWTKVLLMSIKKDGALATARKMIRWLVK